jgi:hypothetical protein
MIVWGFNEEPQFRASGDRLKFFGRPRVSSGRTCPVGTSKLTCRRDVPIQGGARDPKLFTKRTDVRFRPSHSSLCKPKLGRSHLRFSTTLAATSPSRRKSCPCAFTDQRPLVGPRRSSFQTTRVQRKRSIQVAVSWLIEPVSPLTILAKHRSHIGDKQLRSRSRSALSHWCPRPDSNQHVVADNRF